MKFGNVLKCFFFLSGAILFSQLPLFVEQYVIRLEGHLAESDRVMKMYYDAAASCQQSLENYIKKFLDSDDDVFSREGILIQNVQHRNQFLHEAFTAIYQTNSFYRPFVLARYGDREIMKDGWTSFHGGLSFSREGIVWGLFGLCFLWIVFKIVRHYLVKIFRKKSAHSS